MKPDETWTCPVCSAVHDLDEVSVDADEGCVECRTPGVEA